MKTSDCFREQEVMEIILCGRWPDQCSRELRDHVATCATCTDVVEVALALREDRNAAHIDARIPSAGLVWWRAELRSRQETVRAVSKPITLVETFGAAAAAGVAVALLARAWPRLKAFLVSVDFSSLSFSQWGLVIAFALAIFVVAPLAMYFVLSDE